MTNDKETLQSPSIDDLLSNPFEMGPLPEAKPIVEPITTQPLRQMDRLSVEDQQKAQQLANQIPVGNYEAILTYGANAQNSLTSFSNKMLDHVQAKDIGPIGDILKDLMVKLNSLNPDELHQEQPKGLKKLFNRVSSSLQEMMSKYQKLGNQIDRISIQLDHSKRGLLDDVQMLDQLYEQNKNYFEALNIYIAAAEVKRDTLQNEELPKLRQKAEQTGNQMDVQEVNDLQQFIERLDKRMHDLLLSRQITIQSAPQIRMIQQTNQTLAEKIQASISTAIPLWKNQIAIALTLNNQRKAVEAQKQVTSTTNELLLKNSEMLKVNTIETAKENERGLVEIETLKQTQDNLLTTLQETLQIQAEGREKRRTAEIELAKLEEDLKQQMLAIQNNPKNQLPY